MSTAQASATSPITTDPSLQAVGALPGSQPPTYYESTTTLSASGNVPGRPAPTAGHPIPTNPCTFAWPVTATVANTQTLRGLAASPPPNLATEDGYLVGDVVGFVAVAALANALTVVNGGVGGGNVSQISPGSVQCATFCQWNGANWVWVPQWSANGGSGSGGTGYWVNGSQPGPLTGGASDASLTTVGGQGTGGTILDSGPPGFQIKNDHVPTITGGAGGVEEVTSGGWTISTTGTAVPTVFGVVAVEAETAVELAGPGVGIASTPTPPNAVAILDVLSTTKGVRFCPMSDSQRDAIAAVQALMLFNSTTGTYDAYGAYGASIWTAVGASPVFVYQEAGVEGGNQYTAFASAVAAAKAFGAYGPTIVIDGTHGSPVIPGSDGTVTLPAGLTSRSLTAMTNYTLTIQSGAHLVVQDSLYLNGVTLLGQSTDSATCSVNSNVQVVLVNEAFIQSDAPATQPFLLSGAGGELSVRCSDLSTLEGTATAAILDATLGTVNIALSTGATLDANSLTGAGAIGVEIDDSSVFFSQTQPGAGAITWSIGGGTVVTRVVATNTSAESIADGGGAVTVTGWTNTTDSVASGGSWTASTGIFLAPVAGTYNVNATVEFAAIAATLGSEFTIGVYDGATLLKQGVFENPVALLSQKRQVSVSGAFTFAKGDSITIRASQNGGSGAVLLTNVAARNTLSITLAQ